jgi:hypothetical protein
MVNPLGAIADGVDQMIKIVIGLIVLILLLYAGSAILSVLR